MARPLTVPGWLRWLLVLPGAWAGWAIAVLTGVGAHSALAALCPPEQLVSGMCVAPWFRYSERIVVCAGAGLAAALILLFCTLIAPSHRPRVVLVTLAAGAAVAIAMGVLAGAYAELMMALAIGILVSLWLLRSARLSKPARK